MKPLKKMAISHCRYFERSSLTVAEDLPSRAKHFAIFVPDAD